MDGILRNVSFAFVYLDDILIASADPTEHKRHLREVFNLLSLHGITLNRSKCVFGRKEVQYLGHIVNAAGIYPLPGRIKDLQQFPTPRSQNGEIYTGFPCQLLLIKPGLCYFISSPLK